MKELLLFSFFLIASVANSQSPLKGPYLGQIPPGLTPVVFAPGIISTEAMENNLFIADDGNEIYVERTGPGKHMIYLFRLAPAGWQEPVEVGFKDDEGGMTHPTFNRHLGLLITQSSLIEENKPPKLVLWQRKRAGTGWGRPVAVASGMQGSMADNGVIYSTLIDFAKRRGTIARFVPKGDGYSEPEGLPEAVNHPQFSNEIPMIAPDESYVIFTSKRDGDSHGRLYISFRDEKGGWKPAQNLSGALKSPKLGNEWLASLSPDGRYLFFNIDGDVYWVDAEIIRTLK